MAIVIGQWIRLLDPLITNELGWHRMKAADEIMGDVDDRWRIELCCHVVVLVNPKSCERGLPGAGGVVCTPCSMWKKAEVEAA